MTVCLMFVEVDTLLEMVLQSHVEIKGVPSVREADSYESAATCRPQKTLTDRLTVARDQVIVNVHTLTTVILYPQNKISTGVADRFHCYTGILLHRRLGKKLPCRTRGHVNEFL